MKPLTSCKVEAEAIKAGGQAAASRYGGNLLRSLLCTPRRALREAQRGKGQVHVMSFWRVMEYRVVPEVQRRKAMLEAEHEDRAIPRSSGIF